MSISQNYTEVVPSLNLNFVGARKLDPRITFTRGSVGTYMDDNGLIKTAQTNEPRFDHSYDGTNIESLGFLIEESRTNLILQSEAFNTTWTNLSGNATITANAIAAPDGATTADLVDNNGQAVSLLSQSITVSASSTNDYYVTIFAKKGTSNGFTFNCYYVGNAEDNVTFDFTTGTVSGVPYSGEYIFQEYPNGWYRCGFRMTRDSTGTRTTIAFRMWESIRGNTSGSTYFWGAQLEAGAFPTSYIPTIASTVTRSADNASITGTNFTDWYNQSEGTFYVSSRFFADGGVGQRIFQVDDNTNANRNGVTFRNELSGNQIRAFDVNYSASPVGFDFWTFTGSLLNTEYKTAFALKSNDMAAVTNFPNGQETIVTSAARVLQEKTTLRLGSEISNTDPLNGHISQLIYYPKRLTNTQLQNLTR